MLVLKYLPRNQEYEAAWSQVKLTPSVLEMDFSEVQKRVCRFIKEYVENAGAKGIVLGLSGGIDSATIAALSSLAIGGDNVLALMLPETENFNQKDIDDAKVVAEKFKMQTQICDMSNVLESFYKGIPSISNQKTGFVKATLKQELEWFTFTITATSLTESFVEVPTNLKQ